jgi:P27 family predicted phage terminase small subunit
MRGRKPKPLELKVLHGTAMDKARQEQPKPRRTMPRCPDTLTGVAADKWRTLARELYDAGLLTTIDKDALATYCVVFARWVDAEAKLAESGPVLKTAAGNIIQNPYLAIVNRCIEQMGKLEAEFGMTPSSRTRVKAAIVNEPERRQGRPAPSAPVDPANDPRLILGM